ncbi:unnamed protein product [Hyaloperonospora brassicae]|uniref:Uncharacterized protein n=1 Tax=Hyaloperonospora brassicae TaxID=162125 RepID=A0AAV0U7D2_HYABA|nr:unnamed protein product [Hyaloperonospora brassicae]
MDPPPPPVVEPQQERDRRDDHQQQQQVHQQPPSITQSQASRSSFTGDDHEEKSTEQADEAHENDEDINAASTVLAMGYTSTCDTLDAPEPPVRSRRESMTDVNASLESLRRVAQERALDTTALRHWRVLEDGTLVDADECTYSNLRDALRAFTYAVQGAVPREDMYYLAILRRKVAVLELPLVDGPIHVLKLGAVVPEKHFYTSKKLFPIGYETLVNVQITKPVTVAFRLRCKIVHGGKKNSPIFMVELENSAVDIVFRSYVASKAWKKALVHFEGLSVNDLMTVVSESMFAVEMDDSGTPIDVLTPASGEDGFGLLRRNITRVLEGLHKVLLCNDYQFWEQRHPITPNVHARIRSRLKGQLKDMLKVHSSFYKDKISRQLSQQALLEEHSRDPGKLQRHKKKKEETRLEADKRSVREAARKLLEIEMKAQEDVKEAQRRAKEARKNAILECRMEAARQKEARKEASRLAREEEKRMREEEKEIRRALREEEKRKKLEEKEMVMKRRTEEQRQRRQMREEQKAILENGVVTSPLSLRRFGDSGKRKEVYDPHSARQQQLVLLKFVEEERERRRQICLWEKRSEVESEVWARVKARYTSDLNSHSASSYSHLRTITNSHDERGTFPTQVISRAVELDPIPVDCHADLLFVWDFISTFSDCLKLTALPSLRVFVDMMMLSDGSSPVGDGILDDDSVGTLFASLHAELLKALIREFLPLLQLGITIDEFYRTRPLNAFSWPELAREVCQFAIEFKQPSADEVLLKSIKGSKSYRDDSVTHPLRQKLNRRGIHLLEGIPYEEENERTKADAQGMREKDSTTLALEANNAPTKSNDYYGVILVDGVSSRLEVGEKDQHLVVTKIIATKLGSSDVVDSSQDTAGELKDDGADRIQVGHYVMFINGHDVRETSLDDLNGLLSSLKTPHGLLLSSVVPVVKNPVKHIATTQGATKIKCCAFVLKLLRAKGIAGPFNQPVDAELYPDYYTSGDITEPMDLGTISEKVEDEEYENDDVESFVDDVQLVWRNCFAYNSMKAEISNLAQKLSSTFERLMKEWVYTTADRPMIAADEDNCRKCRTVHAKERLLLCDRCDAPYHTFCLDPSLSVVPKGEWFCSPCLADSSFSSGPFQKKVRSMTNSGDGADYKRSEGDLTELEKRLLSAIDLLSQENYSQLTVADRLKVLRVLCELMEESSAVRSIYLSLEEKANDVRKNLGEPLADLEREWDQFLPPRSSHGVEQTNKFIIDGVEHELTDELLTYLEEKAHAELESKPVPVLPGSARKKLFDGSNTVKEEAVTVAMDADDDDLSDNSDAEEEMFLEEFGDRFLQASTTPSKISSPENAYSVLSPRPLCAFCGLEDGILNGPLVSCKQSPLTAQTTLLREYELPDWLVDMLMARTLAANDLATLHLEDTADGVQYVEGSDTMSSLMLDFGYSESQEAPPGGVKGIVYAINDRVVFGMSCDAVRHHLSAATQPILLYLTSLPGDAVRSSVSIVKCHGLPLELTLDAHESYVFVQSYRSSADLPVGFGELSRRVFPGDVLLMVNDIPLHEKTLADVEALLDVECSRDATCVVFARPPSTKMRKAEEEWQRTVYDVPSQRAKLTALRSDLLALQMSGPTSYEVVFEDGPLGLALALESRGVVVKSLNDHPDGTLGQASKSGRILRGDLVERVNNESYGQLSDLSQFTSWLLSLPRPLKITFSRQPRGEGVQAVTFDEVTKNLAEVVSNPSLLCKRLKLPTSSKVKTYRVDSLPLPFEAENCLDSLGVIAMKGLVYCEQYANWNEVDNEAAMLTVEFGDRIVGLNGRSVAGLSWATLTALCVDLSSTCPVYIHFTASVRHTTLLQAHKSCVESANVAWSECSSMLPRIEKIRAVESLIKWLVIPRTFAFGKCRHGYTYYRFNSDRRRLFVMSPEKKWLVCARRTQLVQLLSYLDEDSKDSMIAFQIRWCYHWTLHSDEERLLLQQGPSCCEYSIEAFLQDGPFSIEKEVLLVVDEDAEKFESFVGYYGRTYFLGSFCTQQEAESTLQRAETLIRSTGFHVVVATDASTLRNANFPSSLTAPSPKAELVVKRVFMRKYEYGSMVDAVGGMKPVPISQSIYRIIQHGLRSKKAMLNNNLDATRSSLHQTGMPSVATPRTQGELQSFAYAAAQARYQEILKRKHSQIEDPRAHQVADHLKRSRYAEPSGPANIQQQYALGAVNNALSFKRSLQSLVDQGRSMLAAWNQFAASATMQTTNGLAYACLSSFEEVKKVVSRIVVDPRATHPDRKTFVCLHHAYVMGLVCATATQALTTSKKTRSDSALVKQIADAFATAILSCVDPSNMLRTRALGGFATAAKKCELSERAGDLSVELHNVANFVLMFLRLTRYLSGATFDDLSNCRPLFTSTTPGVESMPPSFVQQINVLESIRQTFYRKMNMASSTSISSQNQATTSVPSLPIAAHGKTSGSFAEKMPTKRTQNLSQVSNNSMLVNVEFGSGPLGVVINYSSHGAIVVTEFSSDSNKLMGQAQASGKVQVGDEVYAVNGNKLGVIGMEGFKAAVATSKRPLQVTFRRMLPATLGASVHTQNSNLSFNYCPPIMGTSGPPHQVSPAVNQQLQQPNAFDQQMQARSINSNGLYDNAQAQGGSIAPGVDSVNSSENYQSTTPGQFPGMSGNMNSYPFSSVPSGQPMGNPPSQYNNMSLTDTAPGLIGDMPVQSFPAASTGASSYEVLPDIYNVGTTSAQNGQSTEVRWQGVSDTTVLQLYPLESTPNVLSMNDNGNMQMPMDSMPSLPNASSAMGYPPAVQPSSEASNSYQTNNSTGEFVSFVTGNDPRLLPNGRDVSQVNYYDTNETIYRGDSDFEIAASADVLDGTTVGTTDDRAIADVDTEPESPSLSQTTTPLQSDVEGERSDADRQHDREAQLERLQAASSALQDAPAEVNSSSGPASASATPAEVSCAAGDVRTTAPATAMPQSEQEVSNVELPHQATTTMPCDQPGGKEPSATEESGVSRRSSRVPRKITNIADMYDPELGKANNKGGLASGGEAGTGDATDGEIGELATELLEDFGATIRPQKKDLPRSLQLLRAQLLTMESAIPRDAFRSGRWGRPVRAAWAEMVYACDLSATLMEAVVYLEANIDPEWLDPCWKTSPLPSAKNAIATATIASAAMRLYSLDDAISYGRMKRGGKRKHRNSSSVNSNRPGSPQKTAIVSEKAKSAEPVSDPSKLPFLSHLTAGIIRLANKMIHNILEAQRERSLTTYAYRKARNEVAAITSLAVDQVEQWITATSAGHIQTTSVSGQSQSGIGRQALPKRKHPGTHPTKMVGQRSVPCRKRRAQGSAIVVAPVAKPLETQYVELRCFQMKTPRHSFPIGSAQDVTLRSRLEHIMGVVLKNELAVAFSAPVNLKLVPGYADVIKHPMDLGTIKTRLSCGSYDQRFERLVRDVDLVWENCFTFNRLDADISRCANRLRSIFNRLFEQWVTDVLPNTPVSHLASEELCRQCGQMNAQESMLLCDSCDAAYHAFCLQPPLSVVPPGDWYCPRCPLKKLTT